MNILTNDNPAVGHDGTLQLSVGASRKETHWRPKETTWSRLCERLSKPTVTAETAAEYKAAPKSRRADIKDVGGFVGGTVKGGRRTAGSVGWRSLLTLDLDNLTAHDDPWSDVEMLVGCEAVLYSTHSHTAEKPRYRLVLPLRRPVNPDEYEAIGRRLAADIGIELFDPTTFEPSRLMYWPSVSQDAPYVYRHLQAAAWLDPDEYLARYDDWRDASTWPRSDKAPEIVKREMKKVGDPRQKDGLIGAFCRAHPIREAIAEFLGDVYKEERDGRYTYAAGSAMGGLVIYDDVFAYSHHGTDPAGGRLCNAFDLVRIHLFGMLDEDSETLSEDASFAAMLRYAGEDKETTAEAVRSRLAAADGVEEDEDWLRLLEVDKRGKICQTINNAYIILTHDPVLKDSIGYNRMTDAIMAIGGLPWNAADGERLWTDADDSGLRQYLEHAYGVGGSQRVLDALNNAATAHAYHPVQDYLAGLPAWDGVPRVDALLIDLLGAEDTPYVRAVTRKTLIAAVARALVPGIKYDYMTVLVGPQGCGKSTFCRWLGGKWFNDSVTLVGTKDSYEQLQYSWIVEIGELAAARRSDIETLKMFLSTTADTFRAAYARRTRTVQRGCVFIGTTNSDIFLRDATGNRRFWPVQILGVDGVKAVARMTEELRQQVFAEALAAWKTGKEELFLDAEMLVNATEQQAAYSEDDGRLGLLADFLERRLPEDWDQMGSQDRYAWLQRGETGTVRRTQVSAIEIWCELFGNAAAAFGKKDAYEISDMMKHMSEWVRAKKPKRVPVYGPQRYWSRNTP